MKNLSKSIALVVCSLLYGSYAAAQSVPSIVRNPDSGQYLKHIDFQKVPEKAPVFKFGEIRMYTDTNKFETLSDLRLVRQETDRDHVTHYRWQQVINNIPIENGIYIQHVKNGKVLSQSGSWVRSANFLAKTPGIKEEQALQFALKFVGATKYSWQEPEEEKSIKLLRNDPAATYFPKGELVYYNDGILKRANLRLAYKFTISSIKPFNRELVYVDAQSGKILGTQDLIIDADVAATAQTAYSGSQTIETTHTGANYTLEETGRGGGIKTFNMTGKTLLSQAVDFNNSSTSWTTFSPAIDQYATDAHWGLEKTYDFYNTKYGRNSVNNAGLPLIGYVHYNFIGIDGDGTNNNAKWDGGLKVMKFGDGDAGYHPFVAMDIVGHEVTHGVTQFTSQLPNSMEGGAMNEAFSDMMGISIKFWAKGLSTWAIGSETGLTLRDLSNPKAHLMPNTYHGTYYYTTSGCSPNNSNDACGVHTNMGVGDYWFYLLSQGGTGTNDLSHAYSVTGLGTDKADFIAYTTFTQYLNSTSQYADARTESITMAQTSYSVGSLAERSVTNAWYAVGIGAAYPTETISGDFAPFSCIGATQTFSIGNPIAGLSYKWTVSNGIQINGSSTGNTVTVQVIGNGYNVVTLNVVTALSGTEPIVSKNELVGIPPLVVNATMDRTPQPSHYQYLTATVTQIPNTVTSSYKWYIEVGGVPTTLIGTGLQLTNYGIAPCSVLYYDCVLTTTCGNSVYRGYAYNTYCGPIANPRAYIAYPNPANNMLTVASVASQNSSGAVAPTDAANVAAAPVSPFSIVLYDSKGNIVRTGQTKTGESQVSIETQTIQNGTYFLHILEGSKKIEKQIIISH